MGRKTQLILWTLFPAGFIFLFAAYFTGVLLSKMGAGHNRCPFFDRVFSSSIIVLGNKDRVIIVSSSFVSLLHKVLKKAAAQSF